MTKLVVEVHDASDLMPQDGQGSASPFVEVDFKDGQGSASPFVEVDFKDGQGSASPFVEVDFKDGQGSASPFVEVDFKDGQGSASPFVEVDFDDQRQRTQTKHRDLNPYWNEKLVFNVNHPRELYHKTIDVVVHNDRNGTHQKNFLGRVRIYGGSVPMSESEATVQRYPLDKRGLFSNIKGDIALRIYLVHDGSSGYPPTPEAGPVDERDPPLQEINANNLEEQREEIRVEEKEKKIRVEEKEKEVRTFHSVGSAPPPPPAAQGEL